MISHIVEGDCLESLRGMGDASVDAIVCDPPYGLSSPIMGDDMVGVLRTWLGVGQSRGAGFMGKKWDAMVPSPDVWAECLRMLKPGGHALVFGGTRTYDLMVLAMRIAGFEIRDQLAWMYGSGFPKSLDVRKAIETAHGISDPTHFVDAWGRWHGWGTALKPAQEPIVLARKPLAGTVAANVLAHGTGAINIDACRIEAHGRPLIESRAEASVSTFGDGLNGSRGTTDVGRWPANVLFDEDAAAALDEQTGILHARGNRTPSTSGGGDGATVKPGAARLSNHHTREDLRQDGGASRFFYCAKASRSEREAGLDAAGIPVKSAGELTDREDGSDGLKSPRAGAGRTSAGRRNSHPTVKPVALMRYLCRLITPPGGVVLDPYAGSGTTGCAAKLEGFGFIGLELEAEYCAIARARIGAV